ncbi:glycosyl hydrolase, partial [Eubacterium sp.]
KSKDDPKWICFLEGQYGGYDTYWVGKNLNTLSDAIWLADQFKDNDMKTMTNDMVEGVEDYLKFWFDPYKAYINGQYVDDYFYYDKEYGTLIGYPTSYDSDKQVNDHHFHYGYWIKAAAAVAMKDPQWAKEWGGMVYEMIGDIANANRDGSSYNKNSETRYPFLRNFDIYEGHSWASGVANYEFDENGQMVDKKGGLSGGNNQESSSESVNAWSSLILWGEAVGDERIRDLGIYMYTTEIAAIEDYYYDVHNEIFTKEYKDSNNYNIQTVTRLFGGRYDHTAWWTENPIEVTTITMLPISGSTLYMGKYKEKVKAVVDSIGENGKQWTNFVNNKEQICANYGKKDMLTDPKTNQDVVAEYYAYYDPDAALEKVDLSDTGKVENGESRAHTLAYITSLKEYGNQNFYITGSTPLSVVLEKNGVKTYIVENHTDKTQRTYFSDKTYVDVPANSVYAGGKSGDGENPNKDDTKETTKPEETTKNTQETTKTETTTIKQEITTQKPEVTTTQETTTKTATDDSKYASLNYIDIGNNKNDEFDKGLYGCKYAVVNGTLNVCQFQNSGFGELYMAVGGISAANFTATINGQKVTRTEGTGLFINPVVDYITYKYNVVEITADDGTATVIIMNPNKTGTYNESSIIETTTEKQSETTSKEETTSKVETTTEKQSETTTKEEATSKVETTTEKQNETTTKEETTTKKQEETVSKEQTTTDKLNESTTEQIQVTTKDEIKENQSTKENNHSDVTTTANKEGLSTGGVGNGENYQAPGKVKKLKVKKKSLKKIRLSWKKVSGANGYQVSVKVRKKGKFKVVKTIRKNKNKYIRRKYRKKIIYVKVRAFKVIDGKKIYGRYSAVKKYKNK